MAGPMLRWVYPNRWLQRDQAFASHSHVSLKGQHATYTINQLKAYRSGTRQTDPNQMMRNVASRYARLAAGPLLTLCVALVAGVSALDYYTGREMNVGLLYLAPIFIAAWLSRSVACFTGSMSLPSSAVRPSTGSPRAVYSALMYWIVLRGRVLEQGRDIVLPERGHSQWQEFLEALREAESVATP